MDVINTAKYKTASELSTAVQEASKLNETTFLLIDDKLYMVVPAEIAKDRIAEKIATRLAENPSILHDLQSRLQNEKAEDWE